MTVHELKCHPEPFEALWSGDKTCEVRKNDRGYCVGDKIILRRYVPEKNEYTGAQVWATVTHVVYGGHWGLPEDLCVLSIQIDRKFVETGY